MLTTSSTRAGVACALAALALAVAGPATAARADSIRDLQWYVNSLDMSDAWAVSQGDGVVVAILETGMPDTAQPDLAGAVSAGTDLTGVGEVQAHATSIAALIAARGRGGDGVIGLAPAATILPVVTNDTQSMAAGFRWATDHGADVINCSCSLGLAAAPAVEDAVAYALDHDVVVVAAAGNSSGPVEVPASFGGVIAVSGLTQADALTDVSSYGPEVDIAAPAGDFPVAVLDGEYLGTNGGTSGAAALMSGVVALVRSAYPDLDAANVINRVISTARDIGPAGPDDDFGYGAVDPVAAVTADVAPVSDNPLGSPTGPLAGPDAVTTAPAVTAPAASSPGSADPCASARPPAPAGSAATAESAAPADSAAPAAPAATADGCDPALSSPSDTASGGIPALPVAGGAAAVLVLAVAGGIFAVRRRRAA